ncbi:3-oxoacyl-[acyl-carrier protein] reductase [Thermodesulfitimonas autotrophica]|uniref:3-oxoacyl-[acyl-carrier protein] reductase n=1 Tax=Thermodesulfitimonas autotrophica TaxID=1894989 RepID=A0A3N5AQ43_9THEO|nr:3-oxoacyl-ACP reductase family protein [Thermodesulfitimonas autotrophica]RPF46977.1 3-oxoacyl-[acyl-carrier protein] reductase [Thermodesulfitimonas autotrophica]
MNTEQALRGKVAIVTGSSRGIGAAIARELARYGASVAVNYRSSAAAAARVAAACREYGARALAFQADIADPEAVEKLFAAVEESLGPVEILVNNAGTGLRRLVVETTDAEWHQLIAVNLSGAFYCSRRALGSMIRRRWGRIINIASVFGLTGAAYEAAYAAAKGGLIAFTKSLAREVGSAGITVNAVAPGPVESDMLREGLSPEELAALAAEIPSGRLGKPEDIARACVFLASPAASFINGQVLCLDGGWLP